MIPLPVDSALPELLATLCRGGNAVVVAPPGAGKTTRVPPAIAVSGTVPSEHPAVVVLQPRRVAARSVAARIASERKWRLGEEVGYHVRFDRKLGPATLVRILTEGILTRQLASDPALEGVGCVVLDEFHERSLQTDLAIGMLREVQQTIRPDLRIVVMSATMDPAPVARFLGGATVIESAGRLFPIEIAYAASPIESADPAKVSKAIRAELARPGGHILVFLPGMAEIRRTAQDIESAARAAGAVIAPLHGSLPWEDQERALAPSRERKVILSTNIAETSITIEGVTVVIDSGQVRMLRQDPRLGIDRLELSRISRASATQRAGRAGRTAPGRCVRLWTRAEDSVLAESEPPEIRRVDLAGTLLHVHRFGTRDPRDFSWFEAPQEDSISRAERLLELLGAVEASSHRLTPAGEKLAGLPVHPRVGRLLLAGSSLGVGREAAMIAALIEEGEIGGPGPDRRRMHAHEADCDLMERSPDERLPVGVLRVRDELLRLLPRGAETQVPEDTPAAICKALLLAYPDRLSRRAADNPARGILMGKSRVELAPRSVVRRGDLFLAIALAPEKIDGHDGFRVDAASVVEEGWLQELLPSCVRVEKEGRYDAALERVVVSRRLRYLDMTVAETVTGEAPDAEVAAAALARELARDLPAVLERDEAARGWLRRVALLRRYMPELVLPEFGDDSLREALALACAGCRTLEQAKARALRQQLESPLSHTQRRAIEEHAPEAIGVPTGNRIRLAYQDDGPPILAVRLQEVFGMTKTPRVAAGRVAVLMHLLAPNYRPAQITSDLESFWAKGYFEVRKDLRARYPKHAWPENPLEAKPAAKGGRRSR